MFAGVLDDEELQMLTSVLDEYCREMSINSAPDRDEAARRIVDLFSGGVVSREPLAAALRGKSWTTGE